MPDQSNTPRQSKYSRLREIVERLGQDATPAEIRQEAYIVGFGAVNAPMLACVRNDLWPDRPKRGGGLPTAIRPPSMASCPDCGSTRTKAGSRHVRKDGTPRRLHYCHDCNARFHTEGEEARPKRSRESDRLRALTATERTCTSCREVLPVSAFGKLPCGILHRSHCRTCSNEKRARNGIKAKLAEFGLTVEWYDETLAKQGGGCAICGSMDPGTMGGRRKNATCNRRFAIDHSHTTKLARGLLCSKCNLGLGNFNDDADRIESAVAYLRRFADEHAVIQAEGGDQ